MEQPQRPQNQPYSPQNPHPPHQTSGRALSPNDYDRPHHHHHHHHHKHSEHKEKREHATRDSLIGAAGGGLLGDLLLGPGVGTLGGAILGAIGGNHHGKKKDEKG